MIVLCFLTVFGPTKCNVYEGTITIVPSSTTGRESIVVSLLGFCHGATKVVDE